MYLGNCEFDAIDLCKEFMANIFIYFSKDFSCSIAIIIIIIIIADGIIS